MVEKSFFRLQHSETVVAEMASRLLAAYIGASQVNQFNEDEIIDKSLLMALRLAKKADKLIESDDEDRDA